MSEETWEDGMRGVGEAGVAGGKDGVHAVGGRGDMGEVDG